MQFKDMLNNKAEAINDIIKGFLPAEDTMSCEVEKAMNYSVMACLLYTSPSPRD